MAGPIKPEDVVKAKEKLIPEEVFLAFNKMIAKKMGRFKFNI